MLGFQSPALEIDLAKAVRADDVAAAERFRVGRLARGGDQGTSTSKNRGGVATSPRPVRPATGGIGAPRRSSG
ncbi:MAG TPA: hypothetical protein VLK34_04720 [Nocardioidaceae bacterium]|nr:hypothetical protein [Nocardioidaceae bacterium]